MRRYLSSFAYLAFFGVLGWGISVVANRYFDSAHAEDRAAKAWAVPFATRSLSECSHLPGITLNRCISDTIDTARLLKGDEYANVVASEILKSPVMKDQRLAHE